MLFSTVQQSESAICIHISPVILIALINVHLSKQNMNSLRTHDSQFENSGILKTNYRKVQKEDNQHWARMYSSLSCDMCIHMTNLREALRLQRQVR